MFSLYYPRIYLGVLTLPVRTDAGVRLAVPGVRTDAGVRLTVAERVPPAGEALNILCVLRADLVPVDGALFGPRDTLITVLGGKGGLLAGDLLFLVLFNVGGEGGFLAVVGFLGDTLPIVIFMFDGF